MNYRNYNIDELTNEILATEEGLMSSNQEISTMTFSVLLSKRNTLIKETRYRGLDYSHIVRNQL